jgi:ABC-type antimicrobial peptide transport system permease subunit
MAAVDPTSFNLSGGAEPIEIGGELVTANLLSLLGVRAVRGRGFQPVDDTPGSPPVAIVSYGLWQRRYGGDSGLIGRSIILDGRSYPVVGVMPPNFSDVYNTFFKTNAQVWISGLDLTENKGWGVQVIGIRDQVVGSVRRGLEVLMAAVAFVLLIASANLASLLLSRSSAREREVAIRAAMGASRRRAVRQLLTESLLLAAVGGVLGVLLARVEALPGVHSASVASGLPIQNWAGMGLVTEDNPSPAPGRMPDANYLVIAPHYFRAMGIPLRDGRPFSDSDTMQSPRVVIVNEELARTNWPGVDVIGKRLRTGTGDGMPWLTVVGVGADVRTGGPDDAFRPELYIPYMQYPWLLSPRLLVVRTIIDPLAMASSIRREVLTLDNSQPVSDIRPLDLVAGEPAAQRRFLMVLLGVFAAMALILAGVGIYGVLAYSVARRAHEIGIRMALGAASADVMKLVLTQGFRLALFGVLAGLAGALVLTRALASVLFGVSPSDPGTFALVTAQLALVAFVACYIPARRATKADPAVALRYE